MSRRITYCLSILKNPNYQTFKIYSYSTLQKVFQSYIICVKLSQIRQVKLKHEICAIRQGGILFWILELLLISWRWGRYFQMFLFYFEIVNNMRQVSIVISDFTHSIASKHAGSAILSLYDSLQPSISKSCKFYIEKCEKLWFKLIEACRRRWK